MAHSIPLPAANDFTPIPEGSHVFKITKVDYNERVGKLELTLTTKEGQNHVERFALKKDGKTYNEKALKALGYFSRVALNNWEINAIDPEKLAGHFIQATVSHDTQPHRDDPNKTITFIRLDDKKSASCYEDGTTEPKGGTPTVSLPESEPATAETADEEEDVDLDDLLADI